jgi:two-component system, chemotaxis family, sensor kinase Cph1
MRRKVSGLLGACHSSRAQMRRWFRLLACGWVLLIVVSFSGTLLHHRQEIKNIAIAQARAYLNRDQALRAWASSHSGIYVPVTPETPPNPYLSHLPHRDIQGPNGQLFTMINPAYMVRQINERFPRSYGAQWHVTSLNPLRPEHTPDPWEQQALESFERGEREAAEFVAIDGEPYLRFISAMITKENCLPCHHQQGFQSGHVSGGVAISLSMAPLHDIFLSGVWTSLFVHFTLMLLGLGALFAGRWCIGRKIEERDTAEEALRASEEKFRTVADFTYAWEYWRLPDGRLSYVSPSCERISGYAPAEFLRDPGLVTALVFPEDRDLFTEHTDGGPGCRETGDTSYRIVTRDGRVRWVNHICQPVYGSGGEYLGRRVSIYDITERKKAEEMKERLIAELQEALGKVKVLSGLLPICANCKKIRDDGGYWNQIENYIGAHSEAEFSHGICPDCIEVLYPGISLAKKNEPGS